MNWPRLPRNAQLWLPGYVRSRVDRLRRAPADRPVHVLFCVADHYEPDHGRATAQQERARVARWLADYPRLTEGVRDADGRPPRHTFFFPAEAYRAEHLDALAQLCSAGFGEVEVHLHHGNDSSDGLRRTLTTFTNTMVEQHGLLSRHPDGRVAYGFIHGNWALDNGGHDASTCGVNDELTILRETGCYADFTMPAGADPAQSRVVNQIYYAVDDPTAPRSYDQGTPARVGQTPDPRALLLIEGPLVVWWDLARRRLLPRVDSGTLDASPGNRPSAERFRRWIEAGIAVRGRADWVFVKVHTHGAPERNAEVLLGEPMRRFHQQIAELFNDGVQHQLHYVTAREMFNIVKAAEAGEQGNPGAFRDYVLSPPAVAAGD